MPCRCGHSCTSGPSPRSGTAPATDDGRDVRPCVEPLEVGAAPRARESTTAAGLGQVRRAGDVGDHAAGRTASRRGEQRALQHRRAGRRPPATRRHRASGRRRSAPSPVHGASTSTRSNDGVVPAGRPGRRRRRPRRARATRPADELGPVRLRLVGGQPGAPRLGERRPSSAALPPGPAQRSSQRRSGLRRLERRGRAGRGRPAGCPRPARRHVPSRTAAQRGRVAAVAARRRAATSGPAQRRADAARSARGAARAGRPG